jgi:hypothetical protein
MGSGNHNTMSSKGFLELLEPSKLDACKTTVVLVADSRSANALTNWALAHKPRILAQREGYSKALDT